MPPASRLSGESNVEVRVSDVWDFKKGGDGRWTWQRQSLNHDLIDQGRLAFDKLEECIADARRCGYTGSLSQSDEPARDASGRLLRRTRR